MEGDALLLSYLLKTTTSIANTKAAATPPISPIIVAIALVWGTDGEDCTTTFYLVKTTRITINTIVTTRAPMHPAIGLILRV